MLTCKGFVSVAVYDSSRDRLPVEASDPLERWDSYEDFNNITQDLSTEGNRYFLFNTGCALLTSHGADIRSAFRC